MAAPVTAPPPHPRVPVEWGSTTVYGRRASYGAAGEPGGGPPIVFLHGWGLTAQAYVSALGSLAARSGRPVIAPTLPGFGSTAGLPARQVSFAGYGQWVAAFCREMGIDGRASVVGHSFGGGVAVTLAHQEPDLAGNLVLVNAVGGGAWLTSSDGRTRTIAERPLWDWGLHFPGDILPPPAGMRILPRVLGEAVPNVMRNPRAVWGVANLARTADLSEELAGLKARGLPVAVIWSERDRIVTRANHDATCLRLGLPGRVVPGGHSWPIADPGLFGRTVTEVLAAHAPRRAAPVRRLVSRLGDGVRRSAGPPAAG
ncbi:MAG TPA: alpha/beta hydrolase [Acidimicrobiales bacterium]|nr:alpha/beta hydrolase [Acidimicrobiales bacterium]